jgi:ribosomal protein S18 acetylase RimI-like enzyme
MEGARDKSSTAVVLRQARRGDELAVAELHVRSWQEAYRGLMPADFLDALDPRQRAGRYTFEASGAGAPTTVLAVVGEEGGEGDPSLTNCGEVRSGSPLPPSARIAGFVTYGASRDEDVVGLGEVYALYVDPDRHRGGVGRLLMAEARHRLRKSGFTESILWVLIGNDRAARFYEGEGWIPDGATRVERPYDIVSNVRRFHRALD